jgi:hypothetical protein
MSTPLTLGGTAPSRNQSPWRCPGYMLWLLLRSAAITAQSAP